MTKKQFKDDFENLVTGERIRYSDMGSIITILRTSTYFRLTHPDIEPMMADTADEMIDIIVKGSDGDISVWHRTDIDIDD
jgi:hypothetical protein